VADQTVDGRDVSLGRIFSRAFGVMGHNPLVIFGIAFLFGALPQMIVSALLATAMPPIGGAGYMTGVVTIGIIGGVVGIALSALVQGAIAKATLAEDEGRKAEFGECVAIGLRYALPLILMGILTGLGVMLGMFLLLVPGIILMLMWAVAAPVIVAEKAGVIEAMSRSRDLTKGARWKIVGLFLVLLAIALLISLVNQFVLGGAGRVGQQASFMAGFSIIGILIGMITTAVWATFQTSLYVELRNAKDGPQTLTLDAIFA
jgi:MFS family permease